MPWLRNRQWFSWTQFACALGTIVLLWQVYQRIEANTLIDSLKETRIGWLALAAGVYGVALAVGAVRWHVALRSTERAIHFLASWRLSLIGHFLFTVLFGAVGGDTVKSALYARWFRFALPEVLAAAPLDRVLSLGGALVLAAATGALALGSGGIERIRHVPLPEAGASTLIAVGLTVVLLIMLVLAGRLNGDGAVVRTIRALRSGGWRLLDSPRLAVPGIGAALLAHSALSAVFAFSLAAVSTGPIPWAQLAWTFPAITTLSCLPLTFAGAGLREVSAMTLLGLYGVPAADCVTASVLTLALKLAWAGVGAAVLWRERGRKGQNPAPPSAQSVSVVIPALNEAAAIAGTIHRARANPEVTEIIVVDGGSVDSTVSIARQLGARVLPSQPGRGQQLRAGASVANGDVVLLLHADTWLPPGAAQAALNCLRDGTVVGGGFWKVYQEAPWLLLGSRLKCALRLLFSGRILGDQGMFVRREALERIGGVPAMELMEEFELCRRLRQIGRLALAEATVSTSARRFVEQGLWRTTIRSWRVVWRYWLGTPTHELRRMYEKE